MRAREAYALAPAAGSVLRLLIEFSPESSFTTKNSFLFGVQDHSGRNGGGVQSGRGYGWGGCGVVVSSDGRQQQGPQLSGLPLGDGGFFLQAADLMRPR